MVTPITLKKIMIFILTVINSCLQESSSMVISMEIFMIWLIEGIATISEVTGDKIIKNV